MRRRREKRSLGQAKRLLLTVYSEQLVEKIIKPGKYGQKADAKISAKELGKKHLMPRNHLNALKYLMTIDAFEDVEEANNLIELVISRKTGKLPLTSSDSIESETETED